MVEFIEARSNQYFPLREGRLRAREIWADIDALFQDISYCVVDRGASTGRDPRTHHAFTHHICAEHNIVVKWVR